jgi:uncharacterized protein DUF6544
MSVQRPTVPVVEADVDLHQFFSQGPRVLRRSWFVATLLGESVGFLVPALVAAFAYDLHVAALLPLMVIAGAVEGTVLGIAQAVVLRREFLGLSRVPWAAATAVGAATAWFVGMLPSTFYSTWSDWPPYLTVPVGVVLGLVVLVSVGFAQWTVLRHHVARSRSWVPANAVAWGAGLAVLFGICMPLWREGQPVALTVAIGVLGGLAMAVTVACLTAAWLTRLVCPRDGRTSPRPGPTGIPQGDWAALAAPTDEFRVFDPTALEHLPDPVQRWLRHAVTPGTTLLTGVETEWNGHIRLAGSWRAFCARQRTSLSGGYLWSARSRVCGLPVLGLERYTHDRGELRWRLPGRLRLTKDAGDNATRSLATRHAAELFATVPVVALDPSVQWEAVDHDHATAHVRFDDEDQAVTVTVDPAGRLRQVEVDRWGTPPRSAFGPYRYGALLGEERRFGGCLVPTEVVAGWHIGTKKWDEGTCLRYRVVRCSFH